MKVCRPDYQMSVQGEHKNLVWGILSRLTLSVAGCVTVISKLDWQWQFTEGKQLLLLAKFAIVCPSTWTLSDQSVKFVTVMATYGTSSWHGTQSEFLALSAISADENDLVVVRSAVADLTERWKDVGIYLGICWSDQDTIPSTNCPSDYLSKMLTMWLKQDYDVSTYQLLALIVPLVMGLKYHFWPQ